MATSGVASSFQQLPSVSGQAVMPAAGVPSASVSSGFSLLASSVGLSDAIEFVVGP